ncbi:DUF1826 domain-containing protein [Roseomonas hellenica]|uniref:DUF1826 domain-containing protein n=1 Tax=Plastoroseomonas hellenica TaxID=2687306 RepID=A0ABS5ESW8_9PROT|nr:DUF1826 domain-containing protein [Plastoroseomonas hellenica]MBR0663385.1 DUF1826 domain-containing protein [Plastoroseomonas hellenica]
MSGLLLESFPAASVSPGAEVPTWRCGAASSADPDVLIGILRPENNLAIWHRDIPDALSRALAALAAEAPFTATAEDAPDQAVDALAGALPRPAPLDLLLDIRRLAVAFAAIADTGGDVRIRLEGIAGRACHRWHADAVGLRLLCTYRGAGTEWLPLAGGAPVARSLDDPALPVMRIPRGAVAILKGEGHPGNAGAGCIHRSPRVGFRAGPRLLLCLDAPGRIPLE